jgi:serine-type D-Ala-D-Ala carboxypeptidase/endopeptidase (penicillin-binding protein 4)
MYLPKSFFCNWIPAKVFHSDTVVSQSVQRQRIVQLSLCFVVLSVACSSPKNITQTQTKPYSIASAADSLLLNPALQSAHIGISIYDPETKQYLYEHDAEKYFVPASNTKLFTCYAAMKYLGDSLVGMRYQNISDTAINIFPTGDPTFLHSDFKNNPVLDFLKNSKKTIHFQNRSDWKENALGFGWAWDDYNGNYMVERSSFPIYGNTVNVNLNSLNHHKSYAEIDFKTVPTFFKKSLDSIYSLPLKEKAIPQMDSLIASKLLLKFEIKRNVATNEYNLIESTSNFSNQEIPFHAENTKTTFEILKNDFKMKLKNQMLVDNSLYAETPAHLRIYPIKSQPTDSVLKPMMHRSDNFFAEQLLLMVSNEKLGYFQDAAIIDTLLKTDLKDLPQKPKWVDGSGLSRYNLFTPQSFVQLLNKMENEFGMERLKVILPTGGEGTLSSVYKKYANRIFAKTGTLSNQVALSGYIYTQQNKRLIFSVLVNNHMTTASNVRKAVESFLGTLMENE